MGFAVLRRKDPPRAIRALLVAEVLLFVGGMMTYLWLRLGMDLDVQWYDPVVYALAGAFPIGMNLLHGDRPADSGIRLDNLKDSAKEVAIATAIMAGLALLTGWLSDGFHWKSWGHFGSRVGRYALWGPIQQYMLQAFGLRRFRQAQLPPVAAVVLAAGVFGFLHAPNWPLVALTTASGFVWCTLFLRRPNLLTLGLAHGLLAVLVYYVLPADWLHNLAVGGVYVRGMAGR